MDAIAAAGAAVLAALRAAGVRAFDQVPPGAGLPYVTLTAVQELPDEDDPCLGGGCELYVTLNAWAAPDTVLSVSPTVRAVRAALRHLAVPGFEVVVQDALESRIERVPGDQYARAVMTLRLELAPA